MGSIGDPGSFYQPPPHIPSEEELQNPKGNLGDDGRESIFAKSSNIVSQNSPTQGASVYSSDSSPFMEELQTLADFVGNKYLSPQNLATFADKGLSSYEKNVLVNLQETIQSISNRTEGDDQPPLTESETLAQTSGIRRDVIFLAQSGAFGPQVQQQALNDPMSLLPTLREWYWKPEG